MPSVNFQPLRAWGLALLIGGLLAGLLTGCAARRLRAAETSTAGAAGQPTAANSNVGGTAAPTAAGSAATSANPADQIDTELDKLDTELNSVDTLNDFATALPPDAAATVAPAAASAATNTPSAGQPTPAPRPTTAPSGNDQGAQIEQLLAAMQAQLGKTDTVPEAANP